MNGIEKALSMMVKTWTKFHKAEEALKNAGIGYEDSFIGDMAGNIADAIYDLVGEHTEKFEDSATFTALTAPHLCEERRVALLMYAWRGNHPELARYYEKLDCSEQPKPNLMEAEEIRKMTEKNGGYFRWETPEGDWT